MGLTGLAGFKQQEEARTVKYESPFFKLGPGEKVKIRPLVELDEESKNYSKRNGTANFVREYTNPVKFWLKVTDTYGTEGKSVGHEMVQRFGWYAQNPKADSNQHNDRKRKWNPTIRFYLPVLVDRLDGTDPTVEVLQNTYGEKSPSQALVDFYEAKGSITDRWWTYSRNGKQGVKQEMTDVVYKFVPDDPSKFDVESVEVPNVFDEPYVFNVPYDEQYDFLQIEDTYRENAQPRVYATSGAASSDSDEDWG